MNLNTRPRRFARLLLSLLGLVFVQVGIGAQNQVGAAAQAEPLIVAKLRKVRPDLPIEAVYPAPIGDMVTVELAGGLMLYATADGNHLFSGDLFAVGDGLVNLTEQRRAAKRVVMLEEQPRADMVVFSPVGEVKDHITVFTDVDCGYCRKLHDEMADMNALGIEVRYMAYPRAGLLF